MAKLSRPDDKREIALVLGGGLVNNMPLLPAYGDDRGASLDAIVMVTPSPAYVPAPRAPYRGLGLLNHQLNLLSGLFHPELRRSYVRVGMQRAEQALDAMGWD